MEGEQRGAKGNCSGTIENLLIDIVVRNLCTSWNTLRIVARIRDGYETSEAIRFNKELPQGDALCPRFFTVSHCREPEGIRGIHVIQACECQDNGLTAHR